MTKKMYKTSVQLSYVTLLYCHVIYGVAWRHTIFNDNIMTSPRGSSGTAESVKLKATTTKCPDQCDCFNGDETVDCSRRSVEEFPAVSNATRRLYAEDNRLMTLGESGSLRSASSLTLLVLERNFLEVIDVVDAFCGLTRLQELNLGANRIRSFHIDWRHYSSAADDCQCSSLKELNLALNQLSEIPRNLSLFAPNLEILNLGYNDIERATLDSSFSQLTSLRYLDLSRNRIYAITDTDFAPAAFAVPLEVLSLTECGVVSVGRRAFAGLVNLTSFSLSNNPVRPDSLGPALHGLGDVTHVSVGTSDRLEPSNVHPGYHDNRTNRLTTATDANVVMTTTTSMTSVPRLTRLDISEILVKNLTVSAVGHFINLIVLDASYCELEHVEPELFDLLVNLETLHLEGGRLERLDNVASLRRLRRLHLQENRLHTIVELNGGTQSLEIIDLSRNRIETVPRSWLVGLQNLQVVNLSHNLIRSVEPDSFYQVSIISSLDFSFNRMTSLESYGLVRLERLDFSYNAVERISDDAFKDLHQTLTELNLGHNRLSELNSRAIGQTHGLISLDLSYNNLHRQIAAAPGSESSSAEMQCFQNLQALETLDLSNNGIDVIDCQLIMSLQRLVAINLSGNRLTDLGRTSLACFSPTVARLDLSSNRLSSIDVRLFRTQLNRLEQLDISDNPLDCTGCRLRPLFEWINATAGLYVAHPNKMRCLDDATSGLFSFDSVTSHWTYRCDPESSAYVQQHSPHTARGEGQQGLTPGLMSLVLIPVVGLSIGLGGICAVFSWRYRLTCQKFGKMCYDRRQWQVRYLEVSNLDIPPPPSSGPVYCGNSSSPSSTNVCVNHGFGLQEAT